MLALDDLVDPRIGDAYCKYELYNMARAAYLCVQTDPVSRPAITEVTYSYTTFVCGILSYRVSWMILRCM